MENKSKKASSSTPAAGSSPPPAVNADKVYSCMNSFCKIILYLFNIVFAISGIVVIGMGGWILRHGVSSDIAIIMNTHIYRLGACVLVLVGCGVFIIAIVGVCGIRQDNKCFVLGYIVTLIVILCMVLVPGVFAVAIYTVAENGLEFQMLNTLQRQYGTGGNQLAEDPITAAWNNIQETYDCCGIKTNTSGPRHYKRTNWYREQPIVRRKKVPATCCTKGSNGNFVNQKDCEDNFKGFDNVNRKGCFDSVLQQVAIFTSLLSGGAIGITAMQLLGTAFSFFVMRRM